MNKILQFKISWHISVKYAYALIAVMFLTNVSFAGSTKEYSDLLAQIKDSKVSISISNKSLRSILIELQKQSNIGIAFLDDGLIDSYKLMSINVENCTMKEALDILLKETGLTYNIKNNSINIIRIPQTQPRVVPKIYTVQGSVVDENNKPLVGVTVIVDSTSVGAITDRRGEFTFKSPKEKGVVVFSFIGYLTQKKNFVANTPLHVKMKVDLMKIDEVQIIGYGTQKKRTMVSAISSVNAEDIKEIPTSSVENLLQGRMAGVEVTNMSGAPGGGGTVVAVRGYNSMVDVNLGMSNYGEPLYVIDGIPIQGFSSPITGTNTLSSIDPSTIESIEVLKDAASAAIYGSRAGRGVILITTKKGKEGKARFSANASYSLAFLPSTLEQTGGRAVREYALNSYRNQKSPYKDPATGVYYFPNSKNDIYGLGSHGGVYDHFWTHAVNGYKGSESPVMTYVQDSLNDYYNNSTDWFKYAFQTGTVLNANVQASGGTEKTQYLIGAGFYDEKGIQQGSDFQRLNMLANLNVSPVKNLTIDTRVNLSYRGRNRGTSIDGKSSGKKFDIMPIDPKKSSSFLPGGGGVESKMVDLLNKQVEKNQSYSLMASMALKYQFMEGLTLSVNGSANFGLGSLDSFRPTSLEEDGLNVSRFEVEKTLHVMNENLLNFHRVFNEKHTIDLLAGVSLEKRSQTVYFGEGKGGANDNIHYIYKGFPELPSVSTPTKNAILQHAFSGLQQTALLSFFVRAAYNYKEKYMAEVTFRRDGSSVFGDKNKFANFPAFAAGWAFSDEKFMDWAWWLNRGKFRASYGKSGEVFDDPYRAHGLLEPGGSFLGRPIMDVDNSIYGGMINRKLKWVQHDQYDLGLDLSFLNNKYELKLDYYYRWSTGMLSAFQLPATIYPYEKQWMNANDVSNEGIELEFVANFIQKNNWYWKSRFNLSRNWNRLKNTFDKRDVGVRSQIPQHMLGLPLYMLNTFETGDVYTDQSKLPFIYDKDGNRHTIYLSNSSYPFGVGMKEVKDLNSDLRVDDLDQSYQGATTALISGGWGNDIRWKNLDLSILFMYSIGRHMINMYSLASLEPKDAASGANVYYDLANADWWEPGKSGSSTLPELSAYDKTMLQFYPKIASNVEKVNYIKLKSITLGYNMPEKICKKIKLTNVRFFLTVENLFTITNYSGPDPETVSLYTGLDEYKYYPLARKTTLGLTINF